MGTIPSSLEINLIAQIDLNVYRALFELSRFAGLSRLSSTQMVDLEKTNARLATMEQKYLMKQLSSPSPTPDLLSSHFQSLTLVSIKALQIYSAKIAARRVLSSSPQIQSLFAEALVHLRSCQRTRPASNHMGWIFAIMFCAASTMHDFSIVHQKLAEFVSGFIGIHLYRMKALLEILQGDKILTLCVTRGKNDELISEQLDTLALILQPP